MGRRMTFPGLMWVRDWIFAAVVCSNSRPSAPGRPTLPLRFGWSRSVLSVLTRPGRRDMRCRRRILPKGFVRFLEGRAAPHPG